ncbi:MAG: histidine ammonia-lyase [Acidobacteria bacterium]|nr:histidine ammonia-lyase [Acidobacteriota bacterium]
MNVVIDGAHLTIDEVRQVALGDAGVALSSEALERMAASRAVVERMAAGKEPVYGVNTGVGRLADVRIDAADLAVLQRNIVRSHAAGVGPPLACGEVRAMMLIRANVLAIGLSGIRPLVAEQICQMLNRNVTPVVPSQGSVGASGDLAPLAHIALVLIGEGVAGFQGETLAGAEALRRAGLKPIELNAKEGISLINGTQAMLACGCLRLAEARVLAEAADVVCAMTTDALRGTPRAFDPRLHMARPHPGQLASAARLRELMEGSEIRASHLGCGRVQDAYSLRCAPQVHGAVREAIERAGHVFEIELNSATDNPLVLGDEVLSGGNFHGEPVALQLDFLAIVLTVLSAISERRVDRLVNPALNEGLPAFLAAQPGLESGLMMAQVTAAALVGENRILAHPATPGTITTSGNKEDFVSMGMAAAAKIERVIANTRYVLAIEALAACRGIELSRPLRTSPVLERIRERVRSAAPERPADHELRGDIESVARLIADGGLAPIAAV